MCLKLTRVMVVGVLVILLVRNENNWKGSMFFLAVSCTKLSLSFNIQETHHDRCRLFVWVKDEDQSGYQVHSLALK